MATHGKLTLVFVSFMTFCAGQAAAEVPHRPTLVPESSREARGIENVWSKGVSEENRHAADVLFGEGTALLNESIFISAAVKYREALEKWDHPAIHYNLALALMNLDQPVEIYEHLTSAIEYGAEPLGKDRFEHAKNYMALLEKQVARVKIRCDMPGASVEMNGRSLFVPPGEYEGLVRAGMHTIVARREGFVTNHSVRMLEGGKTTTIDLPLETLEELTTYERRWSVWTPWTVVAAGTAVALAGGGLHYAASQKIRSIDREIAAVCSAGCRAGPSDSTSQRSQAETMQKIAVGAYAVGGAAIVVGGVLAYLNRAKMYVKPYDSEAPGQPPQQAATLEVTPVLAPDRFGLSAAGRF